MSNPQTAEEWKTVAANAEAQKKEADARFQQISTRSAELTAAKMVAVAKVRNAKSKEEYDAGLAEQKAILKEQSQIRTDIASIQSEVEGYNTIISNANTQAGVAVTGPPNTSPNTPPATAQPNTPATDVPPPAPVPQVTSEPGTVDNNESVSTAPTAEVGESVFDPANVDPNSDPFEQARYESILASEQEANTEIVLTPAEIDAANDPFEQRRLELEQQANRDELAREENLSVSNDDPASERNDAAAVDAANAQPAYGFNPDSEEQAQAAAKSATLEKARAQNTIANQRRNPNNGDWRVKLRLAPGANYLYNATDPGILQPLKGTGIIFPYTPTINTSYKANYSSYDLTHSNYKGYYYQSSAVEPVSLSCPFTAQSTPEAEYLLAVIHFFKSVTKMFYGQDAERGTPPPLVYLTGLGEFQFNEHPCVVQSFSYELPPDVDYIRARSQNVNNSNMLNKRQSTNPTGPGTTWGGGILGNVLGGAINRLANAGLPKGGMNKQPAPASFGQNSPTYVPTKINISISLLPVQSRKQQSQQFSLKQYASGDLLKGGFW